MNPLILPDAVVVVAIGPGGRTGQYIQVRTQRSAAIPLSREFEEAGVSTSFSIQASVDVPDLVALVVSIGTGLGGVAAVLSSHLRRHQDKALLMERDGTRYELKGMSPEKMDEILARLLEKAAEDQRRTEHLYRGIPGADDEVEAQPEND